MVHRLSAGLVEEFVQKYGSIEQASLHMADELIAMLFISDDLNRIQKYTDRQVSSGYVRRSPSHHARSPEPQMPDPVSDDWISTGRETGNDY
jgi:hypothetical protein